MGPPTVVVAGWKLPQQILGQMGDTGDGALEGPPRCGGRSFGHRSPSARTGGPRFDLVICGLRLEAAQRCDIATHRQRGRATRRTRSDDAHCSQPLGSDHQDGAHLAGVFVVTEGGGGGALPRTTPVKRAVPSRILAYLLASLIAAAGVAVALWLDDVTGTTCSCRCCFPWWCRCGCSVRGGVVTLLITGAACPVVVEPGGGYLQLDATSWLLIERTCSSGRWWSGSAGVWRGRRGIAGALSESERPRRRFGSALDAMPNGLIVVDSTVGVILANDKATDILGASVEGTDLLTDARFMTGHTTDGQRSIGSGIGTAPIASGRPGGSGRRDRGAPLRWSRRIIRTSSAPYYALDGAVGGAVVVFADVTARRAADQARLASEVGSSWTGRSRWRKDCWRWPSLVVPARPTTASSP